ncbi:MAG: HAMP domain-containing histidine kinase [Myxococcales bacterium]|nr:HAMP domain-containing histidine kinase [Myxococcales bacterium]
MSDSASTSSALAEAPLRRSPREHALSALTGEFSDPALEREYRAWSWRPRAKQLATTCLIGALGFAATLVLDLSDHAGSPWLWPALTMRGLSVALLLAASTWFRRRRRYTPAADWVLVALGFAMSLLFLIPTFPLRDRLMYLLLTVLLLIIVNYVFLPNRLRLSLLPGAFMTLLFLGVHARLSAATPGEKGLSVILLLCTNLLGVQFLRVIGRSLREVFATSRALELAVAERARAEETAAIERATSRFYMNISHGLRTPINGIVGYIELIDEDAAEGDLASLREDLRRVRLSSVRLQRTLDRILQLSRFESGRVPINPRRFSPAALTREVTERLDELARAREDTIALDVDEGATLTSDASLIGLCAETLVDNAIRFTERGRVEVSAVVGEDGALTLRVRDTGIGIPKDVQRTIFDAFARADESTIGDAPRTGVSLAVTHKICALLGGSIEVASAPGEGATFTARFPNMSV